MSNSFRLRYFFGLISSAHKIDSVWNEQLNIRNELHKIESSIELARYHELKQLIQSNEFQTNKCDISKLNFKGSAENQLLAEQARLEHSKPIKDYFKFIQSSDFARLKNVTESSQLARFFELKTIVESPDFISRKKETKSLLYKNSPDYPLYNEFTELSKSSDIQFYLKCTKSPLYRNYQKVVDSTELARLTELRSEVQVPAFIQHVAFLKNKKRYETTAEYKLETEFHELEKSKMILAYHKLKKRPELAFFDSWEIAMDENFTKHQLATDLWEPENYWGSKMAGYSFSQKNELQAYKGLKNIEIRNEVLSIVTKAEKSDGKVWDPAFGLIPNKFDFSSAILNTGNSFRFSEGVVEAKVKFTPNKAITSAFSLTGSHPFPQIDVFRSGSDSVGVGVIDQPGVEGFKKSVQIKGLNFNHFHIFRLEVFGNQVVWKINNYEVHREQIARNMGELFLNIIGSIHQPVNGEVLPHHFEIDWVRCLKKK